MNKQQFLDAIRDKIGVLPPQDRERSLDFYSEIIDDRMEDGLTEEQAVEAVGSVEEVSAQILSEAQLPSAEPARIPRKIRVWEIVLLILGAPLWISLLAAAAMLVLSVVLVLLTAYAVLWTGVLVLYTGSPLESSLALQAVSTSSPPAALGLPCCSSARLWSLQAWLLPHSSCATLPRRAFSFWVNTFFWA